jgi:rod shape-determining protein MreD
MRIAETLLFLGWAQVLFVVNTSWLGQASAIHACHCFLVLLVYLGLTRHPSVGASVTVFVGLLVDTYSGGIFGIHLLLYVVVFVVTCVAGRRVNLSLGLYRMAVVLLFDLFFRFSVLLIMAALLDFRFDTARPVLVYALVTALVSPLLFRAFEGTRVWLQQATLEWKHKN